MDVEPPVALLRWPRDADERDRLTREGVPRILLVDAGQPAPLLHDQLEDWIRTPADEHDLILRVRHLDDARHQLDPAAVADGVVHYGGATVVLSPAQARLATALFRQPRRLVAREELAGVWGSKSHSSRALDGATARLRISSRPLASRSQRSARAASCCSLWRSMMSERPRRDLLLELPGPLAQPDVVVLRWPEDAKGREQAEAQGHASLLRVAAGERPPLEWGHLEDWLREPIDYAELDARRVRLRRRLVARQPVWIDHDGLLRRGSRWIALSPMEVRLLEPLLAMKGEVVSRSALHAEVYEGAMARDLRLVDSTLRRLRRRVRPLGVTIHTVRGTGFLLDVGEPAE